MGSHQTQATKGTLKTKLQSNILCISKTRQKWKNNNNNNKDPTNSLVEATCSSMDKDRGIQMGN